MGWDLNDTLFPHRKDLTINSLLDGNAKSEFNTWHWSLKKTNENKLLQPRPDRFEASSFRLLVGILAP